MQAPDVESVVERGERAVRAGRSIWIEGSLGAGRHTVAAALNTRIPKSQIVELLNADQPDALPAVLLPVVAADLNLSSRARILERLPHPVDAARMVVAALNEEERTLLVLIPASWYTPPWRDADDLHMQTRLRALLGTLSFANRIAWISDRSVQPEALGIAVHERLSLGPHRVPFDPNPALWGNYARTASALAGAKPPEATSPLAWRLAVGAAALGASLPRVVAELHHRPQSSSLMGLLELLVHSIRRLPDVAAAVRRAIQPRRPLPRAMITKLTAIPEEHAALVTDCIGYGDPVRAIAMLRQTLDASLPRAGKDLTQTHAAIAEHYQTLDGAPSPDAVSSPQAMEAWVERVHHLGHAGNLGAEAWNELKLPSPEFYWDRARSLSIVRRDYSAAAAIYRACLVRFGDDDYAHHYLAWNLEQTRSDTEESRRHYAEAVRLRPNNPWWNARYVTFLIRSGHGSEARSEWRAALERVDPDGTATARDTWIVCHFHYWVAQALVEVGDWQDAQRVIETAPPQVVAAAEEYREFKALKEDIARVRATERRRFARWMASMSGRRWRVARAMWNEASERFPGLPPPAASDDEGTTARLAWSMPQIYVEVEVNRRGDAQWYACDRQNGEHDGSEDRVTGLPEAFWNWMTRVAHA